MQESGLIDSVVDDAALGIKRKPSLIRIAAVVLFLLVASILAYSIFIKTKPSTENMKPKLALGPSLKNPPIEKIKHSEVDLAAPTATAQVQVAPSQQAAAPAQSVAETQPVQPPSTNPKPAPVAATTVTSVTVAASAAAPISTSVAPVDAKPKENVKPNKQQQEQVKKESAQEFLATAKGETVIKPAEVKVVVKKPRAKVIKKMELKEVKSEKITSAIPLDEGVTREEIIVIQ